MGTNDDKEIGLYQDSVAVADSYAMYSAEVSKYPVLTPEEELYYATMVEDPENKKLLTITISNGVNVYSVNKALLFRSLINNPKYQEIIDSILSCYSKLNSNVNDVDVIYKYKVESSKLGRALNQDELKRIFNIDRGKVLESNELDLAVDEYNNFRYAYDKLFVSNLRLVISIALKYSRVCRAELNDLVNEGNIGLMRAIDRYKASLGFKFSTYATSWIRQSISRSIINNNSTIRLPVHIYDAVIKFRDKVNELEKKYEKELTPEEIAIYLDMPIKVVQYYLDYLQGIAYLDQPISEEEDASLGDMVPSKVDIEETALQNVLKEEIQEILKVLTPREQLVIKMRWGLGEFKGVRYSLEATGKVLHVTAGTIRQIETKAMVKMKRHTLRDKTAGALKIYTK